MHYVNILLDIIVIILDIKIFLYIIYKNVPLQIIIKKCVYQNIYQKNIGIVLFVIN